MMPLPPGEYQRPAQRFDLGGKGIVWVRGRDARVLGVPFPVVSLKQRPRAVST